MIRFSQHLCLPYGNGETWIGYCSRMALDRGLSLWELAGMMEVSPYRIVDCGAASMQLMLDTFTGIDPKALAGNAIERVGERTYRFGHAVFPREALNRSELRVCPACLNEQLSSGEGPKCVRPQASARLQLSSIRTCETHGMILRTVAHTTNPREVHDFARRMLPFLGDADQLLVEAVEDRTTRLERHLLDRVEGRAGQGWLNDLTFHAAAKTAEVLGVIEQHGIWANWNDLDAAQWRTAGDIGFGIVEGGAGSIDAWLKGLTTAFLSSRRAWGLKSIYGRLYEWLSHDCKDCDFDPLRRIMHEHIVSNLPVGPADKIFQWPVESRRVHSAYTLHCETKVPIVAIRRLGQAMSVLNDDRTMTDDRILMAAGEGVELDTRNRKGLSMADFPRPPHPCSLSGSDELIRRFSEGFSLAAVTKRLHLPRDVGPMLLQEKWIVPIYTPNQVSQYLFDSQAIDRFGASMKRKVTTNDTAGLLPLDQAKKRAKSTTAEVFNLLMTERLANVGWDDEKDGYAALLVDSREVAALVRGKELVGLTVRVVEQRLHTTSKVVNALLLEHRLPYRTEINPINRCPQRTVLDADLDQFMRTFASVHTLSTELGFGARGVKAALDRLKVPRAFELKTANATFYRRDQLPDTLLVT